MTADKGLIVAVHNQKLISSLMERTGIEAPLLEVKKDGRALTYVELEKLTVKELAVCDVSFFGQRCIPNTSGATPVKGLFGPDDSAVTKLASLYGLMELRSYQCDDEPI